MMLGGHLSAAGNAQSTVAVICCTVSLVGAIALFAAVDFRERRDRSNRRARLHDWLLGAGFHDRWPPGLSAWMARLSLTQTLRTFEQGLLSAGSSPRHGGGNLLGFATLAGVWLPPGTSFAEQAVRRSAHRA